MYRRNHWYVCKCAKGFSGPDCRVSKCIIMQHVLDKRRFVDHAIVSVYSSDLQRSERRKEKKKKK